MSDFKKQLDSLAASLLDSENEILVWAEEMDDQKVLDMAAMTLVKAAKALEDVRRLADKKFDFEMEVEAESISPVDVEALAALAQEFDSSGDEFLQKEAAVIDQLLINFAQRGLKAKAESEAEKELARLRSEYRAKERDKKYKEPKEAYDKDTKASEAAKAIKKQVKEFRPLEAPLSTRYCPDHPGAMVVRVGDGTYQCSIDKKLIPYQEGFTTEKGNKIPGTSVANQTQSLSDRKLEETHFSTRETKLAE